MGYRWLRCNLIIDLLQRYSAWMPQETTETTGLKESSLADSDSAMSDSPENTEKWVEERVARSEADVRRMTESVESKIDILSTEINTKVGAVSDKVDATRNWVIGVGTALLIVLVSLFIYSLNRTDRVEDRVFENSQRIEQVAPESQAQSGADQGGTQ